MPLGDKWLTIVNKTGNGNDTKILTNDGEEVGGVRRITIHPINRHEMIIATVEMMVKLDIKPHKIIIEPGEE